VGGYVRVGVSSTQSILPRESAPGQLDAHFQTTILLAFCSSQFLKMHLFGTTRQTTMQRWRPGIIVITFLFIKIYFPKVAIHPKTI